MHQLIVSPGNKFTPEFTVKDIFLDNHNWDGYCYHNRDAIREVEKILSCKDDKKGFFVYLPKKSRIASKRLICKYVARHVRHPAIVNTRICGVRWKNSHVLVQG